MKLASLECRAWHTTSPGFGDLSPPSATVGSISILRRACSFRMRCRARCQPRSVRLRLLPHRAPRVAAVRSARDAGRAPAKRSPIWSAAIRPGVVLGPDRAVLLAWLAEALSSRLGLGTGVVLSRLDEEANVAPWLRVANRYGAQVRWAEVEIETCELPSWQFEELIGPTTRLVALTAASPIVGSAPDVRVAADRVHEVGGLLVADAIGAAPYAHVDIDELGADVVAVSAPSWGGPQVGALVFRDPASARRIPAMSLNPYAHGCRAARGGRAPVRPARRADRLDRLPRRTRRIAPRHPPRSGWRPRSARCRTTTTGSSTT